MLGACDLVIPPRPERLSCTATEAEKQERCQDAVNHDKRAKGAERSQKEIGAVAAASSKRAKRGGHGGHRERLASKTLSKRRDVRDST